MMCGANDLTTLTIYLFYKKVAYRAEVCSIFRLFIIFH